MPSQEITLVHDTITVDKTDYTKHIIYSIPDTQELITEVLKRKQQGQVPKIIRSQISYDIELIEPSYAHTDVELYILSSGGAETKVIDKSLFSSKYPVTGTKDITDLFPKTILGINGARLTIRKPTVYFFPVTAKIYVDIKLYMSWGW